jgi:LPS sulfotransferase NodH
MSVTPYDTLDHDFDAGVETELSYFICSTPRSGSYLLCELLFRTGLGGAPEEFFHPDHMARLRSRWGARTLDDYLLALAAHKTGPNGVFGAKVHWGQYQPAFGERDPRGLFPNLRFVHITRRDRVRQAVSWVRAMQTLKWTSAQEQRRAERFDPDDIAHKIKRLTGDEARWEALFDRYEIAPHRVVYEELVEDRERIVRGVLGFIGVPLPAAVEVEQPSLERQADPISEEWIERYKHEKRLP